MFFIGIFGIEEAQKEIGVQNNVICPTCGRLTRLVLFKSYTYLHVFFIPTFRWNVQYWARADCCGQRFMVDPEIGHQVTDGQQPDIRPEHLHPIGTRQAGGRQACSNCGADVEAGFQFCPYCGRRL